MCYFAVGRNVEIKRGMRTANQPPESPKNMSAADSFELAMRTCSPQQRKTMEQIREACDRIAAVDGRISQANVAREVEKTYGRNIYQTIRNVGTYRTYIKQRAIELSLTGSSAKRAGSMVHTTDPIAASQIEILEVQLENARKHIQRLEQGIKQLQPIDAVGLKKVLAAVEQRNGAQGSPSVESPPRISGLTVSSRVKTELGKLLKPDFLARFQLRLEDGEIVNKTELTLVGRAAVKFIVEVTSEKPDQDN